MFEVRLEHLGNAELTDLVRAPELLVQPHMPWAEVETEAEIEHMTIDYLVVGSVRIQMFRLVDNYRTMVVPAGKT